MKLIALDVGTKRIGVAKADSSIRIATPYDAIEVDGGEFAKIASLYRAWEIDAFVIGLPRNSKGEETEQSRYVREFAAQLKKQIPQAKIAFQDESLTSVEAEKRLKKRKKGYRKGDIDSEAATIILQDFLETRTGKRPMSQSASIKNPSVKAKKTHKGLIVLVILAILFGGGGLAVSVYYSASQKAIAEACIPPMLDVMLKPGERFCEEGELTSVDLVSFTVNEGDVVSDIATKLRNAELIRSSLVFQVYFRLNFADQTIKTGTYQLSQTMDMQQIITSLVNGVNSNVFTATILPGWSKFDFIDAFIGYGYSEEEIVEALNADYSDRDFAWIFDGKPAENDLEGYLFGETYEFYRDSSMTEIMEKILSEFAAKVSETEVKENFEARGWSFYQGLTLASIVQRESNSFESAQKVAQIFYNRLEQGMTLGSDVTVQYAVDLVDRNREIYTNNALALEIESPYNTRRNSGLTPGPISNPSISTLVATSTPDESMTDYLYFLTGDDGGMYYSRTDAEHQQNAANYCAVLCNISL